jgi:DegV family protein with EDD domain
MARVAVVTDSSTCLPAELLKAHRITAVPLTFLFDGGPQYDGALSGREFYALLRASRRFPTTAAPAPAAFLEAFRRAAATADSALCVTLPAAFSGTYGSALNAAEMARTELPGFPVRVVDSHCLAMCHGFAVLYAARAVGAGATLAEAEAVVGDVASRAHLLGVLDTLRYLAKSGRVPIVFHWATSLLRIKPVLVAEGEDVRAAGRVRTTRRALDRLVAQVGERLSPERPLHMAVMHADAEAAARTLAGRLRERFQPEELLITESTSVMGAHTGPGFVGVAFFSGEPWSGERGSAPSLEDDVSRLEAALGDVPAPRPAPFLVLVSGLPGSGKSHFSRELCRRYPLAHLNSDALRRALVPRPSHGPAESARLFAAVHALLERLLSRGVSAVLDATSLKEEHRRPLYEIAQRAGAGLIIVRTEAPEAVALERLAGRAGGAGAADASEATEAVYSRMKSEVEPVEGPYITVDTSRDIAPALKSVLQQLNVADRA